MAYIQFLKVTKVLEGTRSERIKKSALRRESILKFLKRKGPSTTRAIAEYFKKTPYDLTGDICRLRWENKIEEIPTHYRLKRQGGK